MTSQQRADEHLRIWQLMRDMGIEPELRLPLFDALAEIERTKNEQQRARQSFRRVSIRAEQNSMEFGPLRAVCGSMEWSHAYNAPRQQTDPV